MAQNQRLIDRQLDRVERMLLRYIEADKAARKEKRAQWRAQKEKLKPPDERLAESDTEDDEPKH
jgi:hypothetical protein